MIPFSSLQIKPQAAKDPIFEMNKKNDEKREEPKKNDIFGFDKKDSPRDLSTASNVSEDNFFDEDIPSDRGLDFSR